MPNYTFEENIQYFGKKLDLTPQEEDLKEGQIILTLDDFSILLSKAEPLGSFSIQTELATLDAPPSADLIKTLASLNFIGIETAGASLSLNKDSTTLYLGLITSPGTTPQDNWEHVLRFAGAAHALVPKLEKYPELTLMIHALSQSEAKPEDITRFKA